MTSTLGTIAAKIAAVVAASGSPAQRYGIKATRRSALARANAAAIRSTPFTLPDLLDETAPGRDEKRATGSDGLLTNANILWTGGGGSSKTSQQRNTGGDCLRLGARLALLSYAKALRHAEMPGRRFRHPSVDGQFDSRRRRRRGEALTSGGREPLSPAVLRTKLETSPSREKAVTSPQVFQLHITNRKQRQAPWQRTFRVCSR